LPKQSVTLDTFHGGINLVSAERDILDSQLFEATDCAVDKIGQITTLFGTESQGNIDNATASTTPGHGLFHWKTDYRKIVASSVKTIISVTMPGINGGEPALFTSPGHGFSVNDIVYVTETNKYNGVYKIHTAATNTFYLKTLTGSNKVQYVANSVGKVSSVNPSQDDSLYALSDYKSGVIDIFSNADDNWFTDSITLGGTDPEAVYYAADGALRVSDGTFSSGSRNKWYGYINRTLFKKSYKPFQIEGFYQSDQEFKSPIGKFNENQEPGSRLTSITTNQSDYTIASDGQSATISSSDLHTDAGGGSAHKIGRLIVTLEANVKQDYNPASNDDDRDFEYLVNLKYGDSSATTSIGSATSSAIGEVLDIASGTMSHESTVSIEFPGNGGPPTSGGQSNHTVVVVSSELGDAIESVKIVALEFFKESYNSPTIAVARGSLQFDFAFAVPSTGKKGSYWDTKWSLGATFIYGEGATRQEGMLSLLRNAHDGSTYIDGVSGTELGAVGSGVDAVEGMCPRVTLSFDYSGPYFKQEVTTAAGVAVLAAEAIDISETDIDVDDGSVFQANDRIAIDSEVMKVSSISSNTLTVVRADKNSIAASHSDNAPIYFVARSEWNPRITGVKLYMKDIHNLEDKVWKPQIEYDFLNGVATVIRTGHQEDILFDTDDRYYCHVGRKFMFEPNLVGNFESETGISFDEKSVYSRFKTATVANGRTYIGNCMVKMRGGEDRTVRMGDTIIKSPFNKYDIFPLSNRIDVAINDGEHIIKLENFNDRLLCFKEETLYIINISQDIEFVEGVYKHRGVQHPAQVFKTDFGVAWANRLGVFLYDGRNITNLTELKGQKLINWTTQISSSETPMVGYEPKGRHLIVCEDNSTAGTYVWIYDFDTRSWVRGTNDTSHRYFDVVKTNFVIDHNEDLIFATAPNTTAAQTHTFLKWSTSAQAGDGFDIKTKEIDFGNVSSRKKVYAVHVTYQSGADTNINVNLAAQTASGVSVYDFNASTSTLYGSQSLDTTSGAWKTAILKPESSINNIYSAYVRMRMDGSGDVPSSFKLNDISIIYRQKPLK